MVKSIIIIIIIIAIKNFLNELILKKKKKMLPCAVFSEWFTSFSFPVAQNFGLICSPSWVMLI